MISHFQEKTYHVSFYFEKVGLSSSLPNIKLTQNSAAEKIILEALQRTYILLYSLIFIRIQEDYALMYTKRRGELETSLHSKE